MNRAKEKELDRLIAQLEGLLERGLKLCEGKKV